MIDRLRVQARQRTDPGHPTATWRRPGSTARFSLVYLVFNTITNLLTQDEQVALLRQRRGSSRRRAGASSSRSFVPTLQRLPPVASASCRSTCTDQHIGIDEYDVVNQLLVSHHVWTSRRWRSTIESSHPIRLACRVRPDGADRRDATGRPLGRLAPWTVRRRQHVAHLGLAEGAIATPQLLGVEQFHRLHASARRLGPETRRRAVIAHQLGDVGQRVETLRTAAELVDFPA